MTDFKSRLTEIVETAYKLLGNKIANGNINVSNEASMQMHLGMILKTLGELYEYSLEERIIVSLETLQEVTTTKTPNGKARCDIEITLRNIKNNTQCTAYIELKYLKKSPTAAVTDERFSVWTDVENLEAYIANSENLGFAIVLTDDCNHTKNKPGNKFCIGSGASMTAGAHPYTQNREVTIKNTYSLQWWGVNEDTIHLLKINI